MYRLPTESTSSTDLAFAPRADAAFSPLAIIQGIHSALIEKSYPARPNVSPLVLQGLGERILEHVQRQVTEVPVETGRNHGADWDRCVLRPMIATFDIFEELGVCRGDSEYIFLLVTVLSLAFELLLLAGSDRAERTRTFLRRTFHFVFVEPEICCKVVDILGAERARLIRQNAGMDVIKAIQGIRMLIPDAITCNAAWDGWMFNNLQGSEATYYFQQTILRRTPPEQEGRLPMYGEDAADKFLQEADTFAPLRRLAASLHDVQVKVFFKYGRHWELNCVTSIDQDGNRSTINTAQGLKIELEPGCSATPTTVPQRMSVKMPTGSTDGFIGTMYIPRGYALRVDDVETVVERTSGVNRSVIETAIGAFEVDGSDYRIRRVNCGSRVIVQNGRR